MANLFETFDVDALPQGNTSFDPLPSGWYVASIAGAELKDTRAGGQYINVRYDIIGPTHQGRVVFGMLNIRNSNPKAEEIGRQQLGEVMRAIGLNKVSDTDELVGGRLEIKLSIEKTEQYGEQNRITAYKAGLSVGAPASTSKASTAPNVAKAPWQK